MVCMTYREEKGRTNRSTEPYEGTITGTIDPTSYFPGISDRTISQISVHGNTYDIKVPSLEAEIQKMWARINTRVSLIHNCANCGAQLEIEENKPIFHCKYCGSTYIIGPAQLYSNY